MSVKRNFETIYDVIDITTHKGDHIMQGIIGKKHKLVLQPSCTSCKGCFFQEHRICIPCPNEMDSGITCIHDDHYFILVLQEVT